MTDSDLPSNEERIASLERAVRDLDAKLDKLASSPEDRSRRPSRTPARSRRSGSRDEPTGQPRAAMQRERSPRAQNLAVDLTREPPWEGLLQRGPLFWISRIGIGLVLLSVVFLFDYAIDRGWLTPAVRVACGCALGCALAWIGIAVQREERWFAQLMLGGASATWYVTGFAAFQVLQIVNYPVAFVFMVAVTLFTFSMAVRQNEAVLSLLGAVGGLGTPFFLYTGHGSLPALVGYTCLVVLGVCSIFLFKGWRSLLAVAVIGAWGALLTAFQDVAPVDRWALQAGIVVLWLVFCSATVWRCLQEASDPARWPRPKSGIIDGLSETALLATPHAYAALLTLVTPQIALFFSRAVWEAPDLLWGGISAVATVAYVQAMLLLRRRSAPQILLSAHSVTAAVLAAVAVALAFDADVQILLWTALSAALLYLGRRFDETAISVCGRILSAVVAFWLLQRLVAGPPDTAVINARGLSDAAVVAGLLIASRWNDRDTARWYVLAAHLALLGWLWRELSALPGGDAIVTTAWGAYGLGLLAASATTRKVGLWTLLAAVAKLFLVDLDRVDPFIRILLFLGFGGLFLGISYYYRDRWSKPDGEEGKHS